MPDILQKVLLRKDKILASEKLDNQCALRLRPEGSVYCDVYFAFVFVLMMQNTARRGRLWWHMSSVVHEFMYGCMLMAVGGWNGWVVQTRAASVISLTAGFASHSYILTRQSGNVSLQTTQPDTVNPSTTCRTHT